MTDEMFLWIGVNIEVIHMSQENDLHYAWIFNINYTLIFNSLKIQIHVLYMNIKPLSWEVIWSSFKLNLVKMLKIVLCNMREFSMTF